MRGKLMERTIRNLKDQFRFPEKLFDFLLDSNAEATFFKVQKLTGFGDWIAWKICDMLESLGFQDSYLDGKEFLYESSIEGQKQFCKYLGFDPISQYDDLVRFMGKTFNTLARPRCQRKKALPEWETCWCKYASKTYWIGKDTHEVYESIRSANNGIGEQLLDSFQTVWNTFAKGSLPNPHSRH